MRNNSIKNSSSEIDGSPYRAVGVQIHNPEIAEAVVRDGEAMRKRRAQLEHEIPSREIYLIYGSFQAATRAEQLRNLRRNGTRHPIGKVPQLCA
jgi:hypothetical protein